MNVSVTRAALLLALPIVFIVTSCQKKAKGDDTTTGAPSPVEIRFAHKVTQYSNLVLDSSYSVSIPGPPGSLAFFTIKDFRYYISNIQFMNSDGDTIKIKDTYFLVEHKKPNSQKLQFTVPAGEYYGMSFLIGIDNAKNLSGPGTGALDPALGMYWNATDGYVMGEMIGTSTASAAADKSFSFRIGGTKAPYDVTARRYFKLGGNISIDPTKKTVINMDTDAKAWLTTPNGPLFVTTPVINAPGADAYKVSQNYFKAFDFVSVKFE